MAGSVKNDNEVNEIAYKRDKRQIHLKRNRDGDRYSYIGEDLKNAKERIDRKLSHPPVISKNGIYSDVIYEVV